MNAEQIIKDALAQIGNGQRELRKQIEAVITQMNQAKISFNDAIGSIDDRMAELVDERLRAEEVFNRAQLEITATLSAMILELGGTDKVKAVQNNSKVTKLVAAET